MKKIFFIINFFGIIDFVYAMPIEHNFYSYSSKCPSHKPFINIHSPNSQCIGCNYLHEIEIEPRHEKDFSICKNRKTYDGYSMLKECPHGSFREFIVYNNFIRCISCEEESLIISTKEECLKCSNRVWEKSSAYPHLNNGLCSMKGK